VNLLQKEFLSRRSEFLQINNTMGKMQKRKCSCCGYMCTERTIRNHLNRKTKPRHTRKRQFDFYEEEDVQEYPYIPVGEDVHEGAFSEQDDIYTEVVDQLQLPEDDMEQQLHDDIEDEIPPHLLDLVDVEIVQDPMDPAAELESEEENTENDEEFLQHQIKFLKNHVGFNL
jgi:hypothetical protein